MIFLSHVCIVLLCVISKYKQSFCGKISDSEEENIKQALVLVDILKSEYSRSLRNNISEDKQTVVTEDSATCGLTNDGNSSITDSKHQKNLPPTMNWKFPVSQIYSNRRRNVEKVSTTSSSTTNQATSSHVKSFIVKLSNSTNKSINATKVSVYTPRNQKEISKMLPKKLNNANIDPVMNQVAKELINEIDIATDMQRQSRRNIIPSTRTHKPINRPTKFKLMKQKFGRSNIFSKTTLRIHMEASTRYPIPLPENNAYCFINPKSALCRTII